MALVGYELEKKRIEEKIREIETQLGRRRAPAASAGKPARKQAARTKRVLSPAARGRISAAQKRRWAEHRKKAAHNEKSGG